MTETPKTAPAIYTEDEVAYREDLLEKLMTLEHVRSILVVRDESPVYQNQILSLQKIIQSWYAAAVSAKAQKPIEPDGVPEGEEETG